MRATLAISGPACGVFNLVKEGRGKHILPEFTRSFLVDVTRNYGGKTAWLHLATGFNEKWIVVIVHMENLWLFGRMPLAAD